MPTLFGVVQGDVRTIPGVRSTETFGYLRLAKQSYAWGAR